MPDSNRSGEKPVFTSGYDLRGNTLPRQLVHWIRIKTRIMGNYDSGPGLICMLRLLALHYVGKPLFAVKIWLNNQYELKRRIRGVINKLKNLRQRRQQEDFEEQAE